MAAHKLYENAVAHVEAGKDEGSYVVVVTDGDREALVVTPDENGDEFTMAKAVDFANLLAVGPPLPPPESAFLPQDLPAPRPQRSTPKAADKAPAETQP